MFTWPNLHVCILWIQRTNDTPTDIYSRLTRMYLFIMCIYFLYTNMFSHPIVCVILCSDLRSKNSNYHLTICIFWFYFFVTIDMIRAASSVRFNSLWINKKKGYDVLTNYNYYQEIYTIQLNILYGTNKNPLEYASNYKCFYQ